jgi:hypothetical protein
MNDKKIIFDNPAFVWIIEYSDNNNDPGDCDEVNEMLVFEYHEKPMSEEDALEEARRSFTSFEKDKNKTLIDMGISVISIKREEC